MGWDFLILRNLFSRSTRKRFISRNLFSQFRGKIAKISSLKVLRYKESEIERSHHVQKQKDVLWVADNVDYNSVPLTGKGIFHGMGVVSITSKQSIWQWQLI